MAVRAAGKPAAAAGVVRPVTAIIKQRFIEGTAAAYEGRKGSGGFGSAGSTGELGVLTSSAGRSSGPLADRGFGGSASMPFLSGAAGASKTEVIPGYTGHVPRMQEVAGRSQSRAARRALTKDAHTLALADPLPADPQYKRSLVAAEAALAGRPSTSAGLRSTAGAGSALGTGSLSHLLEGPLRHLPGYTGHVPGFRLEPETLGRSLGAVTGAALLGSAAGGTALRPATAAPRAGGEPTASSSFVASAGWGAAARGSSSSGGGVAGSTFRPRAWQSPKEGRAALLRAGEEKRALCGTAGFPFVTATAVPPRLHSPDKTLYLHYEQAT